MTKFAGWIATLGVASLCMGMAFSGAWATTPSKKADGASSQPGTTVAAAPNARRTTAQTVVGRNGERKPPALPTQGVRSATADLTRKQAGYLGDSPASLQHFAAEAARQGVSFEEPAGTLRGGPQCGPLSFTQSDDDETVTVGNSLACAINNGAITGENRYARCFDIDTEVGAGQEITVNCVDFGVGANVPTDYTVTVTLATVPACPPTFASLNVLATTDLTLTQDGPIIATAEFDPPVAVPAGSNLVVDIFAPTRIAGEGGDGGAFFIGSNALGESAPSFLLADGCGIADYTPTSDIGSPDMNIVMTVHYTQDELPSGACCNDATQQCDDNVMVTDCQGEYDRFTPDASCSDINPSCGLRLNDDPCLAKLISCNETILINNEDADFDPGLVLQFDPALVFGDVLVPENTLWYKFVATSTSARVQTCGTSDLPNGAADTIVSIFDPRADFGFCFEGECTADGECTTDPALCQVPCDPDVPGSVCAGEQNPTGCCNACRTLTEIVSSSEQCGDFGRHATACTTNFRGLDIGQTYYIVAGSRAGTAPGDIELELQCDCEPGPSGACCLGEENCIDILSFQDGALDCKRSLGTWQGDGTTCADTDPPIVCEDSPDHCNQRVVAACGETFTIDNTNFSTGDNDPVFTCRAVEVTQGVNTWWFTFEATAASATIRTTDSVGPADDTLIAVYDSNTPCSVNSNDEIACNDDDPAGGTLLSNVCVSDLEIGNTYSVQVASWSPSDVGPITVSIECPGECEPCADIECPAGSVVETEGCGGDTNGGCGAEGGPAFDEIACGDTVCGTATGDIGDPGGQIRDLDWYTFSLDQTSEVTWSIDTQFLGTSLFLLILDCETDANGDFINIFFIGDGVTTECNEPGSMTQVLPAGDWAILISPDFSAPACGVENDYVASLSCTPVVAACCQDDVCSMETENGCEALDGIWQGLDTEGSPVTCADSPCAAGACCGFNGACVAADSETQCLTGGGQQGFVCNVTTNELPECGGQCGTTCLGDVNGDGVVSVSDRGFISANVGETSNELICQYDLDGNGVINVSDRGFVSANVGLCTELPDYQNGSGLNGGAPDTRFDSRGGGGQPLVPGGAWLGYGSRCDVDCGCMLEDCTGNVQEGETLCTTDYDDTFNGGCFSDQFVASSAACGDSICGTGGWFDLTNIPCTIDDDCPGFEVGRCGQDGFCSGGPFVGVDADWYEIDLSDATGPTQITLSVDAEFPVAAFIVSDPVDCEAGVTAALGDCDTAEISACLDPGVHFAVVRPFNFDGVVGCDREYTANITCGPCETVDGLELSGSMTIEFFSGDLQGVWNVDLGSAVEGDINTLVNRPQPPYEAPSTLNTEIVDMVLAGSIGAPPETLNLLLRNDVPSPGTVDVSAVDGDGNLTSGDSFFDVFFDIDLPDSGDSFDTAAVPVDIQSLGIGSIPPYGSTYTGPVGGPVDVVRQVCTDTQNFDVPANLAIPDNTPAGVTSVFNVPASGTIQDVDIAVQVEHTWLSDLIITVEHSGVEVDLWIQQCAATVDLDVVMDDEGRDDLACDELQDGPHILTADEIFNGGVGLQAFDGLDRAGNWTITISDNTADDTGTLTSWSLSFCDEFQAEVVGEITSFEQTVVTPESGACCVDGTCTNTPSNTANECLALDGEFFVNQSCDDGFVCPGPCIDNGNACTDACVIFDGLSAYTTVGATTDGPGHPGTDCEYQGDGGLVNNDIWRTYTASCTGTLTVEACNDGTDTPGSTDCDSRIAIYGGDAGICGNPLPFLLECNDDGAGCANFSSIASTEVVAGQDLLIRIGGFGAATFCNGEVNISCEAPPQGACCDGANCLFTSDEANCAFSWFEGEACDDVAGPGLGYGCDDPAGACCNGTTCSNATLSTCPAGSDFHEGESCGSFTCPVGDCCDAPLTAGCSVPTIEACVCESDAFCCDFFWDDQCSTEIETFGCGTCP